MSKAVKVILTICIVAVVLGLAIGVVGAVFGGLKTLSLGWQNGLQVVSSDNLQMQNFSQNVVPTENIKSVKVSADFCQLSFAEGDSFQVTSSYDPAYWTLSISSDAGLLNVELKSKLNNTGLFSFGSIGIPKSATLVITYPRGSDFQSLAVAGSAMTVDLGTLAASDLSVSLNASSVVAQNLDCQNLTLSLNAGSMRFDQVRATQSAGVGLAAGEIVFSSGDISGLNLTVQAGTFTLNGTINGSNSVATQAGAVTLNLAQRESDITFSSNITAGSLKVNGSSIKGIGQNIGSQGTGSGKTQLGISVTAGSVNVTTQ